MSTNYLRQDADNCGNFGLRDSIYAAANEIDRLRALWCEEKSKAMTFYAEVERLRAEVAALKKADPLADYQEQVASIVYAAMRFDREDVTPEWQCGNSHAEYRAQQAATEIAEMLRCALKADLAQRTAERDEARREVCFAYGPMAEALAAAKRRGWDCFEEAK